MTQKSSRGVQQADVWAAADALIAAGDRPTIERVRQKIGSGSPNTVSPMLDAWYRTLPARLGVATTAEGAADLRLPPEVADAARTLWELARRDASDLARQANEGQRDVLDRREEALNAAESELLRREEGFVSTKASLEESLLRANDTIAGLQRQLDGAQQRQAALEKQVHEVRDALAAAQARQESLRAEHEAALARKDAAAHELQQRHDAAQRRAMLEIDRAREETRQAAAQAARDLARSAEARAKLGEARDQALAALRLQEAATASAQHQVAELSSAAAALRLQAHAAEARSKELSEALSVEATAHTATRGLLSTAMSLVPPPVRTAPTKKAPRRTPRPQSGPLGDS